MFKKEYLIYAILTFATFDGIAIDMLATYNIISINVFGYQIGLTPLFYMLVVFVILAIIEILFYSWLIKKLARWINKRKQQKK
jgi:Kef-type K+ transport system membrane component KefB